MQLFSKKINFPPFPPLFLAIISTLEVRDGRFTHGIRTKQMTLTRYYIMFTTTPYYIYRHTAPKKRNTISEEAPL